MEAPEAQCNPDEQAPTEERSGTQQIPVLTIVQNRTNEMNTSLQIRAHFGDNSAAITYQESPSPRVHRQANDVTTVEGLAPDESPTLPRERLVETLERDKRLGDPLEATYLLEEQFQRSSTDATQQLYSANKFSDPRKQIRLVTIEPGESSDPIICRISVHDIYKASYMALSYRWGDATDTAEIFVNELPLQVTKSLEGILRSFQQTRGEPEEWERKKPVYWIDALCIDQRNDEEKTHQVQMMSSIYQRATLTSIWLGEEADDSSKAFEFFADLKSKFTKDEPLKRTVGSNKYSEEWRKTQTGQWMLEAFESDQGRVWRAIHNIFAREYWSRCWIVQEVALSRKLILHCGRNYITFFTRDLDLATLVVFLDNVGWQLSFAPKFLQRLPYGPNRVAVIRRCIQNRDENQSNSLFHLLSLAAMQLSLDPRDRIFSLLGMVHDRTEYHYQADYRKPASKVYREVTRLFMIRNTPNNLLSMVLSWPQHREHLSNLPSCKLPVSDWSFNSPVSNQMFSQGVPDFSSSDDYSQLLASGLGKKIFTAAGSTTSKFSFDENLEHLNIDGFCFDIINNTSGPMLKPVPERPKGNIIPIEWREFVDAISSNHSSTWLGNINEKDAKISILPRTLIADRDIFAENDEGRARSGLYRVIRSITNGPLAASADNALSLQRMKVIYSRLRHRQLVTTQEGALGLGPSDAREGDCIYILLGVRTPLVLRKVDDHYVLIGECYVDGIMDGETIPDLESGKYVLGTFNIH